MSNRASFFITIEDCLIPSDGNVSPQYFEALSWIARKGMEANIGGSPSIVLCTRRGKTFVEFAASLFGMPNSFLAIEAGAIFYNPLLKEEVINPALLGGRRLFDKIRRKFIPRILKKHECLFLYSESMAGIVFEREHTSKVMLRDIYEEIRKELAGYVKRRELIIISGEKRIEIVLAKINRTSIVKFLAEKNGLDLSRVVGIGSSKEDLTFWRKARFIGCPSSADDECKKLVKSKRGHVSNRPYAEGVVEVMRHFLQEQED